MPSEAATRDFDIREYGEILFRRKWIVVATLILVVAGAYFRSDSQTRLYSATGEILFTRRSTAGAVDGAFSANSSSDPQRSLATDVRLIQSSEVRKLAVVFYKDATAISAVAATDTDVIRLTAVSPDPKTTDRTVTAYMRAFLQYRTTSALDDVKAAQQVLTTRIENLRKQVADLDVSIAKTSGPSRDELLSQRGSLTGQQDLARQQIDRLNEVVNFQDTTRVLTRPDVPTAPFAPKPKRAASQAALIGLVLGIGLAFLRDVIDDTIKTREDLTHAAPKLSTLGVIPAVTAPKLTPYELVSVTRPDSAAAESYRSLRTSVQFMGLDRPLQVIQVTSPVAGEGKTTTVANLAVALASVGQRVIVVCCDLRRPKIHRLFNLTNDVGFTSVLLGEAQLPAALQPVPGMPGLLVLASGKPPPNPAELLAGARSEKLFTALAEHADIVLVDSPPVLPVTDAAVIANRVDGTILVASAGKSVRKRFKHALDVLDHVDSHVIGVVLNDAPKGVAGYGYGYEYGSDADSESADAGWNGSSSFPFAKSTPFATKKAKAANVGAIPQGRRRR